MYVKDSMTRNPYTVGLDQSVSETLDIMSASKVHRLPVVDQKGKVLGLVTESLIASNTPNNSSSLSVYELNYLLNKLKVSDVMVKDIFTIGPDALLEEAATLLRKHDIGCLPVVDENNILLGIITHNDIFETFIDLLGYNTDGGRYVINVPEDKPGIMEGISHICKENNVSISNLAVYHTERGIEVVVITNTTEDISNKLIEAGYNVTSFMKLHEKN